MKYRAAISTPYHRKDFHVRSARYSSIFSDHARARCPSSSLGALRSIQGHGLGDLVEESDPPYHNAMAAMRDGWQVIQMSELKHRSPQEGYELGPLPYQIVLSKFNELQKEEGATS